MQQIGWKFRRMFPDVSAGSFLINGNLDWCAYFQILLYQASLFSNYYFFKIAQARGANLGSFGFLIYFLSQGAPWTTRLLCRPLNTNKKLIFLLVYLSGDHHDLHRGRGAAVVLADVVGRAARDLLRGMHPHEGLRNARPRKLRPYHSKVRPCQLFCLKKITCLFQSQSSVCAYLYGLTRVRILLTQVHFKANPVSALVCMASSALG